MKETDNSVIPSGIEINNSSPMQKGENNALSPGLWFGILLGAGCLLVPRKYANIGSLDLISFATYILLILIWFETLSKRLISQLNYLKIMFEITVLILFLTMSYYRIIIGQVNDLSELSRNIFFALIILIAHYMSTLELNRTQSERFIKIIVGSAACSMLISIVFAVAPNTIMARFGDLRALSAGAGFVRATSPFGGPNLVGALGATIFPLAMLFSGYKKYIMAFIIVLSVILTGSKTGVVSLIAGAGLYALIFLSRKPKQSLLIILLIGLGTLVAIHYGLRVTALLNPEAALQSEGSNRIEVWKETFTLIGQRPLTGWGKDSLYFGAFSGHIFTAHNLWLQLLLDYGLLAGFIVILMILLFSANIIHLGLKLGDIGIVLASSMWTFLITTLGDYIFWEKRALVLISLLFGSFRMLINSLQTLRKVS